MMMDGSKSKNIRALKEAAKRNGLIYKKHDKGNVSESVRLRDENGKRFELNKDLTIKKCDEDGNELAAARDAALKKRVKSISDSKASYKMQKGLQKA